MDVGFVFDKQIFCVREPVFHLAGQENDGFHFAQTQPVQLQGEASVLLKLQGRCGHRHIGRRTRVRGIVRRAAGQKAKQATAAQGYVSRPGKGTRIAPFASRSG